MRGAVLLGTLLAVQAELTPTEQFNLIKLGFIKNRPIFGFPVFFFWHFCIFDFSWLDRFSKTFDLELKNFPLKKKC